MIELTERQYGDMRQLASAVVEGSRKHPLYEQVNDLYEELDEHFSLWCANETALEINHLLKGKVPVEMHQVDSADEDLVNLERSTPLVHNLRLFFDFEHMTQPQVEKTVDLLRQYSHFESFTVVPENAVDTVFNILRGIKIKTLDLTRAYKGRRLTKKHVASLNRFLESNPPVETLKLSRFWPNLDGLQNNTSIKVKRSSFYYSYTL